MSNDALVLLAALSSIQLSKGLTAEQIGLLAAFFTCLGDNLALLTLNFSNRCDSPTAQKDKKAPAAVRRGPAS